MGYHMIIKTNAEGYKDSTAGKAIQNVDWHPGDVVDWQRTVNGSIGQAVILSVHNGFSSALELQEMPNKENDHNVLARTPMHCDTGRIIVLWHNRITALIKTMDGDAFDKLLTHVGKVLGSVKVVTQVSDNSAEIEELRRNLMRTEVERDTYLNLYNKMIERLTI